MKDIHELLNVLSVANWYFDKHVNSFSLEIRQSILKYIFQLLK